MKRVYNFSAGPSAMPESVLKIAADEMLCYQNSGMSVMEMSHRSKEYQAIIDSAFSSLREVMQIPDNYNILFMQGGATAQFDAVPLNLMKKGSADFVDTGMWSKKAIKLAKKYGNVRVLASSEESAYDHIPEFNEADIDPNADYFYMCMNNTVAGTRFTKLPDTKGVPIVTDMSSCILSEVYDVSKFGLIFAGAQKNMGPAGVAAVIVRDDLMDSCMDITPELYNYKVNFEKGSMLNTPPTYTIYMLKLMLDWVKEMGGVAELQKINEKKAAMLYDYLDNSKLFKGRVAKKDRSMMNVTFVIGDTDMEKRFVAEAKEAGLVNLGGHRSMGGMRASIYNAMPIEGVKALIEFMEKFEAANK
jgi:phosphoserine aminotransferase